MLKKLQKWKKMLDEKPAVEEKKIAQTGDNSTQATIENTPEDGAITAEENKVVDEVIEVDLELKDTSSAMLRRRERILMNSTEEAQDTEISFKCAWILFFGGLALMLVCLLLAFNTIHGV